MCPTHGALDGIHYYLCTATTAVPLSPPPHLSSQVAAALGVPVEKQRYWVWNQRQNHTSRPTARLKASDEAQTLVDLKEYRAKEDGRVRGGEGGGAALSTRGDVCVCVGGG